MASKSRETIMVMARDAAFSYEISESVDGNNWKTTTITCHGRLASQNTAAMHDVVKPLIDAGGSIRIDLTDVTYMDSAALGSLVSLKVSALNKGYCKLELVNLSARVKQLLTMTNLMQLFSQES